MSSGAHAPTRPRAAHLGPERRRPLVLDAALEVFLAHGFEGASMDAIARAAGVSKPVVYDCFAGKDELFKALFQREQARVVAAIEAALPASLPADPEAAFVDTYAAFLRAVAAAPETYRVILLGEGGTNSALARRIRAQRNRQVDAAATIARSWVGAGDEHAARLFGELLIGIGEAGARALLSDRDDWTPDSLAPRLARVAVAALPPQSR